MLGRKNCLVDCARDLRSLADLSLPKELEQKAEWAIIQKYSNLLCPQPRPDSNRYDSLPKPIRNLMNYFDRKSQK